MLIKRIMLLAALCLAPACATDDSYDSDDATAEELAALPDDLPAHEDLAAIEATMVIPDDGATFDNVDVGPVVDEPLYDEEDVADDGVTSIANAPLLKWGLAPRASNALRAAGITSGRIMQTIGGAAASAGTHLQDGVVGGVPYSAATDLSVSGLSQTQIRNLLEKLAKVGFAAWYRHNGYDHWVGVNHIHAVYANLKMKSSLRSQVYSWLANRTGLVSNTIYTFHHFTQAAHDFVYHRFGQSAHGTTNGGSDCYVGGLYCGGDKIAGNSGWLYRCTGSGAPTLVKKCAHSCSVNSGSDDSCK